MAAAVRSGDRNFGGSTSAHERDALCGDCDLLPIRGPGELKRYGGDASVSRLAPVGLGTHQRAERVRIREPGSIRRRLRALERHVASLHEEPEITSVGVDGVDPLLIDAIANEDEASARRARGAGQGQCDERC